MRQCRISFLYSRNHSQKQQKMLQRCVRTNRQKAWPTPNLKCRSVLMQKQRQKAWPTPNLKRRNVSMQKQLCSTLRRKKRTFERIFIGVYRTLMVCVITDDLYIKSKIHLFIYVSEGTFEIEPRDFIKRSSGLYIKMKFVYL